MGGANRSALANGKGAMSAATQHGYRRGTSFGGYEPRCGEDDDLLDSLQRPHHET
jgi:hypothetical protein